MDDINLNFEDMFRTTETRKLEAEVRSLMDREEENKRSAADISGYEAADYEGYKPADTVP
jgi:hypothetical protein